MKEGLIGIGLLAALIAFLWILPGKRSSSQAVEQISAVDATTSNTALSLGIALNHYAMDHNGRFPEGKTSTEVFQKLLDGNYISDPSVLYVDLPGKVKATTKTLQPENVCWDVTCCVDRNSSDLLPIVFLTGYQVNYIAGTKVIPRPEPPHSWSDWWNGKTPSPRIVAAVAYKGNFKALLKVDADGSIPNFIPANFEPRHRVYRQLTPDGLLTP